MTPATASGPATSPRNGTPRGAAGLIPFVLSASLLACGGPSNPGVPPRGAAGADASSDDVASIGVDASKDATGDDAGANAGGDAAPADARAEGPDGAEGGDGATAGGPLCTVVTGGTDGGTDGGTSGGLVLSGTLILPAGPVTGELFIDAAGTIACAAVSCSNAGGYAAATKIACPNAVISASLINAHDHTEYATRGPDTLPTTRFEHRNDWRTGAEGATALPHVSNTTDVPTIAAQELRFVLGGATAVVGSGAVGGLMRNLADRANPSYLEGLAGSPVFFDTFPLGDSNGTELTIGLRLSEPQTRRTHSPARRRTRRTSRRGSTLAAENEFTCGPAGPNDLITAADGDRSTASASTRPTSAASQKAGARLIWSPRSNVALYGNTAPVTRYQDHGRHDRARHRLARRRGSMNLLRELACADSLNHEVLRQALLRSPTSGRWSPRTPRIAAGADGRSGSLAAGHVADIAVFDGSKRRDYRAVIGADVEDVHARAARGQGALRRRRPRRARSLARLHGARRLWAARARSASTRPR